MSIYERPRMYDRQFLLRYQNVHKQDAIIQALVTPHLNQPRQNSKVFQKNNGNISKTPNPKNHEKVKVVYQPKSERKNGQTVKNFASILGNSHNSSENLQNSSLNKPSIPVLLDMPKGPEAHTPYKSSVKEGLSLSTPATRPATSPPSSPLSTPSHSSPRIYSPFSKPPATPNYLSTQSLQSPSTHTLTTSSLNQSTPFRSSSKSVPRTQQGSSLAASRSPPVSPRSVQARALSPSSVPRSGYSSPSKRVVRPISPLDSVRLNQRQKQIDYGYKTVGYLRYRLFVAKDQRKPEHPRTPKKSQACSKRSWDGQLKKWRRDLHLWDPTNMDAFKSLLSSELVENIVLQNPDLAEIVRSVREKLNNPQSEDQESETESEENDDHDDEDDVEDDGEDQTQNYENETNDYEGKKQSEVKRNVARTLVYT